MSALTSEQLIRLFERTQGERLHALWILLGPAGLRRGEALGLEWIDVDLDAGRG
jgi:integrase